MADGVAGSTGSGLASWERLHGDLSARDPAQLTPDELDELARACFWLGRPREAIEARRRAYTLHQADHDHERAARAAWQLFHGHYDLDETSAASGWLTRALRHVEEAPDSVERGYVAVAGAMWSGYCGELGEARDRAWFAHELGRAEGDRDLTTWALAMHGGMAVMAGHVTTGMTHLDEAMVEVGLGGLDPYVTGWVYCFLLKVCQAVGDVERAGEWTDAAVRWCAQQGVDSWYPGLCRLHRCEVESLRGDWSTAEREARRAAVELAPFGAYLVAEGEYLTGEIRRRRGDVEGAEAAFQRAHELGHDPQPGRALLRLAAGDAASAAAQLRVALVGGSHRPLGRGRLLAAHVRAASAAGDVDAAVTSAEELTALAEATGSRLLAALSSRARGETSLAAGDTVAAVGALRAAEAAFRQLGCPYEVAETQLLLGRSILREGDRDGAQMAFRAARAAFERLGATPDVRRADEALGQAPARPAGLSDREVEVLRLVADGLSNREVAAALVISEHTVRRHLSNLYRKIGVGTRAAATAYAFEHDLA